MAWLRDPAVQKLIEGAVVAILALIFGILGARGQVAQVREENRQLRAEVGQMREYLEETQPGYMQYRGR